MTLVLYELDEHVATITLNRPEALNALNRELSRELAEAFARLRSEDDAWVGIVYGAGGRAFSAGADLKEMSVRRASEAAGEAQPRSPLAGFLQSSSSDRFGGTQLFKPLVAAIDGWCLAGGLELALSCDIRIASESSRFGLTEVTRGIIAGAGGTQRLPRVLPLAIAMELLLTGRHMDAEEALRYGLVNRVVPAGRALTAALEVARTIAANAPLAVRATKEAALRGLGLPLDEGMRIEGYLSQLVSRTQDASEGPRAFAEKRPARFTGR